MVLPGMEERLAPSSTGTRAATHWQEHLRSASLIPMRQIILAKSVIMTLVTEIELSPSDPADWMEPVPEEDSRTRMAPSPQCSREHRARL